MTRALRSLKLPPEFPISNGFLRPLFTHASGWSSLGFRYIGQQSVSCGPSHLSQHNFPPFCDAVLPPVLLLLRLALCKLFEEVVLLRMLLLHVVLAAPPTAFILDKLGNLVVAPVE